MTGFRLGRILAVVCLAALMYSPSFAQAQERPLVELVSVEREAGVARILVRFGGRVRDVNRIARRHATAPGLHVDIDMLAEWNPNRVIYVCFDNLRGERPMMSRNPATESNCIGYRSTRWLRAGETYLVPLQPTAAPAPTVVPPTAAPTVRDPEDRRRIAELEAEVAMLADSLDDAEAGLLAAASPAAPAATAPREDRSTWFVLIGVLLGMGLCFLAFFFVRRQWQEEKGRELEMLAIRIRGAALESKRKVEHALAAMRSKRDELAKLYGRRRLRTKILLVQLAKYRKLLRQCLHTIKNFQRQQSEEIARRERLPELLKQVDDARLHLMYANNARTRAEMVAGWSKLLRRGEAYSSTLRRTLVGTYRRMLTDYRIDRRDHEQKAKELAPARNEAIEVFYALTGIRASSVEPEVRLQRSIDAADKNAAIVQAQSEAMNDLLQAHIALQGSFGVREHAIVVRENQIAEVEADLVDRMREHDARVASWEKEHEVKKTLDLWTGGLAHAESAGKLSVVEKRMSELEGRMAGYERRAASAEHELSQTNDFLGKVQREFRQAKELLEGIKKGPNFLEARTAQMAEYISMLEEKLGIERKSIWGGLPELAYGAIPPKAKA
ncbi:hypothetical protein K8R04_00190 [Candidatus Uhrbacteria bacterium]|nr:hypothetical protein [Candidatus Uhrbacteria bacterium]